MKVSKRYPEDFWIYVDQADAELTNGIVVVDLETTSLNPALGKIVAIGLGYPWADRVDIYFDEGDWRSVFKIILKNKSFAAWNVRFDKSFLEANGFQRINCVAYLSDMLEANIPEKCWLELQPHDYAALSKYPYPFKVEDPFTHRLRRMRVSDVYRRYRGEGGLPRKALASLIINKNYWDVVRESWWLIQYMYELSRT